MTQRSSDSVGVKIGIVMPSFNQGLFIEAAIQSVLSNAKNADIRFVVMDGGSTDGSVEIIKKYETELAYWQSAPDGGQSAAINAGMQHVSECDYVMWLNSDDVYDSDDAVQKLANFAVASDADVCFGKSRLIDKGGAGIGDYKTAPVLTPEALRETCVISQPSVMLRKRVWDAVGGLDENLIMCMDYDLWIRLAKKVRFAYLEEYIGNSRIYSGTKSARQQARHLAEGIHILSREFSHVPIAWLAETYAYKKGISLQGKLTPAKAIMLLAVRLFRRQFTRKYILEAERMIAGNR